MLLINRHKAPFWARVWWLGERVVNRAIGRIELNKLRFEASNIKLDTPIAADLVVSLTTHGSRFADVHLTLASILRGNLRPAVILLWIDNADLFDRITPELRRLMDHGVDLILTDNLGPHTKYFPALQKIHDHGYAFLATADDDIIYPKTWLADLYAASTIMPNTIHAHRCHRVRFKPKGGLAPYSTWAPSFRKRAGKRAFFTGVSGVIYPRLFCEELAHRGREFLNTAPTADDVWLNFVAHASNFDVVQISSIPRHFPMIPGSQKTALVHSNVAGTGNDIQLRDTYSKYSKSPWRRRPYGG